MKSRKSVSPGQLELTVHRVKIWIGHEKLKVYFLNPDVVDNWMHKGVPINVTNIMGWAQMWNPSMELPIPVFDMTVINDGRAQIRVKFSGTYTYINYAHYRSQTFDRLSKISS